MMNWDISGTMRLSQSPFVGLTQLNAGKISGNKNLAQTQAKPSLFFGSDTLSLKKTPRLETDLPKRTLRFSGVFDIIDMEAFDHIEHLIPTIAETKGDVRWYYANDGRELIVTGKDAAKARDLEQLVDDEDLPDDGAMSASIIHENDLLRNVRPQSELLDPTKH